MPATILPLFAMLVAILHTPPDLSSLQWKNRVVVAFAATEDDPALQQQIKILEKEKSGVEERDIRVFAVVGASAPVESLRRELHCPPEGFAVVLVGKDGGTKLHRTHALAAEELFGTIDKMPMRRNEIRQNH